ncbi:MAG: LptE family protein, partial [Elusimicrobia bacterium]|nr:LptE family protein [Elusimicrobiota bacterium]
MKKTIFLFVLFLTACASDNIVYRPAAQILPQHIKSIAVKNFSNKSQQFGLEEKLTLKIIEEFLKDGQYKIVPETEADGILSGEISHYILTPIQYDRNMVAMVYKLNVIVGVRFLDRKGNFYLWQEPAIQTTKIYSASTLPGGLTEEQAREQIWDIMAKDIVKRTVQGFGSATSVS